ncbi:hypothetical protein D1007_58090 [Hordeum vulgare]|nr:hypothetical protein D1007_58090 [Hordeum vulgare]
MLYEQKDREIQEVLSQKQYMANLLQEKEAIIHSLNSARFEQENKLQAKLRSFEHDLNVMGQMISGYKKALKQSRASFSEYRKEFPCNKSRYHDVPNGGGLVLSVNELKRKRWEEEQQKRPAATEMIEISSLNGFRSLMTGKSASAICGAKLWLRGVRGAADLVEDWGASARGRSRGGLRAGEVSRCMNSFPKIMTLIFTD